MDRGIKGVPDIVFEYFGLIQLMESTPGMYHLDSRRQQLHEEICNKYGVKKEAVSEALEISYPGNVCKFHLMLLDSQLPTNDEPKGE